MADKKLSDVTSVEDFDYFLGVKSNGDVQKMSKDSMKKVISELMSSFLQIKSPKNFIVSNPSNMETGIISIGDASREISKSEKLNEPSEDIPFIRGMDSNGNPIYIGTEQFSSVLAGLIGINNTWFRDGGIVINPDNCLNNRVYMINISLGTINFDLFTYGNLLYFSQGEYHTQIAMSIYDNKRFTRMSSNGGNSWGEWREF